MFQTVRRKMRPINRPSPIVLARRRSICNSPAAPPALRHLTARKVPVCLCIAAFTTPSEPSPKIVFLLPDACTFSSKAARKSYIVNLGNVMGCLCNGPWGTIAPIAAAATSSDLDASAAVGGEEITASVLHFSEPG